MPQCRIPIFFVNGTNDKHYPLNSYARTYGLVTGTRQLRIEVNMAHGHQAGWKPKEIGLFVDQYLRDGEPLPRLQDPVVEGEDVSVAYVSGLKVKRAQLHYTADDGPLVDRRWQSRSANVGATHLRATVPADATIWMMSVTDSRDAMVSTGVVFADSR